jgi:hypothetical protein
MFDIVQMMHVLVAMIHHIGWMLLVVIIVVWALISIIGVVQANAKNQGMIAWNQQCARNRLLWQKSNHY